MTGFDESLIFQMLTWVLKEMWNLKHYFYCSNCHSTGFNNEGGDKELETKKASLKVLHQSAIIPLWIF